MKESREIEVNVNDELASNEKFRVNITMSTEMVDFYQKMADSMGIARSTCMVIGLKTYMDQQNMLKFTSKFGNSSI